MIKTILVPVDGSEIAERALEPAAWLSQTFDDDLRIVMSSFSANTRQEEKILEIYRLEAGRWVVLGAHAADDVVRPEPFDAVELQLGRWWMPRSD